MNTMTARSNPSSARDWISNNRRPLGIAAAILAALVVLWLIFAPAKITPFTIGAGEGMNAHVDYATSIDLAEQNSIKVTYGPGWGGEPLSYDAARALGDTLDRDQVTVHVLVGDHFDADGVYHSVGSVVAAN